MKLNIVNVLNTCVESIVLRQLKMLCSSVEPPCRWQRYLAHRWANSSWLYNCVQASKRKMHVELFWCWIVHSGYSKLLVIQCVVASILIPGSSDALVHYRNRRDQSADLESHTRLHLECLPHSLMPDNHIKIPFKWVNPNRFLSGITFWWPIYLTQRNESFMQTAYLLLRRRSRRTGDLDSSDTQRHTPASCPQRSSCWSIGVCNTQPATIMPSLFSYNRKTLDSNIKVSLFIYYKLKYFVIFRKCATASVTSAYYKWVPMTSQQCSAYIFRIKVVYSISSQVSFLLHFWIIIEEEEQASANMTRDK